MLVCFRTEYKYMFDNFKSSNFYEHLPVKNNQKTSGPVNAHLISGAPVSTKTSFAKFDIVLKWVNVNSVSSFI